MMFPVRICLAILIKKLCRNVTVLVLQVKELKLLAPLVRISSDGFNVSRVEIRVGKSSSCSRIEWKRDIQCACLIAFIDFIFKSFKFSVTESLLPLRFLIKRTALRCTASICYSNCLDKGSQTSDAYSNMGLHSVLYAKSLIFSNGKRVPSLITCLCLGLNGKTRN